MDQSCISFIQTRDTSLAPRSIQAVLALHGEGATVPFIARYRKEKTGNLDEVQIRTVVDSFEEYGEIVKRKDFVLKEIEKQGNLTSEMKRRLQAVFDLNEIEEIYRPFKKKKKTKATLAREAGIGTLADWIWGLAHGEVTDATTLEVKAKEYVSAAKGFATYDEVLRGAQHIVVEKIANEPSLRDSVRDEFYKNGRVRSQKTTEFKTHSKFDMYGDFSEAVRSLENRKASHRYLALRRGWQEGELKVTMEADEAKLLSQFEAFSASVDNAAGQFMKAAAKQALSVHVIPSITNELHTYLKERADLDAISVFVENVKRVLMSSPFGSRVILGVDPGIRTGCKIALVDRGGQFVTHTVLHIQGDEVKEKAKALFGEVVQKIKIDAIAVGNGTGGREAESFIRGVLKDLGHEVPVIMVSESGASVYSASDIAREEFPDLDVTVRGAISIARRLQDPLSELVKIEPKSIGVGQYQHDVNATKLKKSLHDVVESCVNQVGVELNTASGSLLQYVSGIGPGIAKNIVEFRSKNGLFKERDDLLKVPHFSGKVFEQAAGFLRIADSKVILDRTGIHPERYAAIREMAHDLGANVSALLGTGVEKLRPLREKWSGLIGEFTFDDILRELEKPGRDPRDVFKLFQYRDDVHELKDLKGGMICPGIVTNVTNFGAFVDIGVHQDGLVHISELSHDFVEDPRKVVNPGDMVQVKVLAVDLDKSQISLSMKLDERPKPQPKPRPEKREARPRDKQRDGAPRGDRRDRRPNGPPPNRQQRPDRPKPQPFNNPFAALTGIKK